MQGAWLYTKCRVGHTVCSVESAFQAVQSAHTCTHTQRDSMPPCVVHFTARTRDVRINEGPRHYRGGGGAQEGVWAPT